MSKRKRLHSHAALDTIKLDQMPLVACYMNHRKGNSNFSGAGRSNYGTNSMQFEFLGVKFWFSYDTLIAFHIPGKPIIKTKNEWNQTTSRHLWAIHCNARWSEDCEEYSYADFSVVYNNMMREAFPGHEAFFPPLRAIHDKKGQFDGIGFLKPGEQAIPDPPPKRSDFYLHPVRARRSDKKWMREQKRREKCRIALEQNPPEIALHEVEMFV